MSLTQSYEPQRDLLTGMLYKRGNTAVAQRTYTYDTLGRPLTRSTARSGKTVNDSFGYNNRSELTTAMVNGGAYAYDYDNIGNRLSSQSSAGAEADAAITTYATNELNQYTALSVDGVPCFQPEYDADGNQCRVKTSTGIWAVSYDTENRPTDFTSQAVDGTITTVHCEYDYMGRRATKQVTTNGSITLHQRYIYRGYLQIACIDLTRAAHPGLWLITWDPTQNIATRPLAIQKDGTWYTYGWDLTKNICEVFGPAGYLRTAYTYTPYGQVTANGDVEQPIQWSSEFNDTELGLIYYNYRHYNPVDGRWIGRDTMEENENLLLYVYCSNNAIAFYDVIGLYAGFSSEGIANIPVALRESFKYLVKNANKIAGKLPGIITFVISLSECVSFLFTLKDDYPTCFKTQKEHGIWIAETRAEKKEGIQSCVSAFVQLVAGALAGPWAALFMFLIEKSTDYIVDNLSNSTIDEMFGLDKQIPVKCNCDYKN